MHIIHILSSFEYPIWPIPNPQVWQADFTACVPNLLIRFWSFIDHKIICLT